MLLRELLEAIRSGKRLEARQRAAYAGEAVEFLPRVDEANGHPDFYPWHVMGRPDYDRLSGAEVVIVP